MNEQLLKIRQAALDREAEAKHQEYKRRINENSARMKAWIGMSNFVLKAYPFLSDYNFSLYSSNCRNCARERLPI